MNQVTRTVLKPYLIVQKSADLALCLQSTTKNWCSVWTLQIGREHKQGLRVRSQHMGGGCAHYTQERQRERERAISVPSVTSQGLVKSGASVGIHSSFLGCLLAGQEHWLLVGNVGEEIFLHIMGPLIAKNQNSESESGKFYIIIVQQLQQ